MCIRDSYKRVSVIDIFDVINRVEESKYIDCYLTIFSDWQRKNRIFDTIFLDVDGGTEYYEKIIKGLEGFKLRKYYSGRGYHIFLDFEPQKFYNYREVVRKFIEDCGLKNYVDMQCLGDISRYSRLPNTVNSKTDGMMIPLNSEEIEDSINSNLNPILEFYDGEFKDTIQDDMPERELLLREYFINNNGFSSLPMCIQELIKTVVEVGYLPHTHRLHLATFLLKVWRYDTVKQLFSLLEDYDEDKTDYQLTYIVERNLMPYKCSNAKALGFCPFEKMWRCPFYPSLHRWIIGGMTL